MSDRLAPNSVRTYRLAPEGFTGARNKLLRQRAVLFVGIVVFVLAVQYRQFGDTFQRRSIVSFLPALFALVICLGALAVGAKRGIRRDQDSWLSYELVIGDDFLIRKMKDFRELEIQRHEITAIKENDTGIRVETNSKQNVIGIPFALVEYEDAKARLSEWMVPVREPERWLTPARLTVVLSLLVLILFSLSFFATRSLVIVASGVPLVAILCWSIVAINKSLHSSAYVKRVSFVAVLPLLAVAAKLILAIINWR